MSVRLKTREGGLSNKENTKWKKKACVGSH